MPGKAKTLLTRGLNNPLGQGLAPCDIGSGKEPAEKFLSLPLSCLEMLLFFGLVERIPEDGVLTSHNQ